MSLDTDSSISTSVAIVQPENTATLAPDNDFIRPTRTRDLHQRPALTSMPLVHTEEITGLGRSSDRWLTVPSAGPGSCRGLGGSNRTLRHTFAVHHLKQGTGMSGLRMLF